MISCHLHDYLEIACMYKYRVRVDLTNGESVDGVATDTRTTANKLEYLVVETTAGTQEISHQNLKSLEALDPNPHFDRIEF